MPKSAINDDRWNCIKIASHNIQRYIKYNHQHMVWLCTILPNIIRLRVKLELNICLYYHGWL